MATNTAGSVARYSNQQAIHYIRADFNVAEVDVSGGVTKTIGVIPAGAVIIRAISGVHVHVAFDDTTVVDIGTSTTGDLWGTNIVTTATGTIPIDEAVTNKVYVDTTVVASFVPAGTSVTVGAASVIIAYVPANEGTNTWLGAQS